MIACKEGHAEIIHDGDLCPLCASIAKGKERKAMDPIDAIDLLTAVVNAQACVMKVLCTCEVRDNGSRVVDLECLIHGPNASREISDLLQQVSTFGIERAAAYKLVHRQFRGVAEEQPEKRRGPAPGRKYCTCPKDKNKQVVKIKPTCGKHAGMTLDQVKEQTEVE